MKTIALLNCSDPCSKVSLRPTIDWLASLGYTLEISPYMYKESSPLERAEIFNRCVRQNIPYIFDVSGGDLANETIPYLDLEAYRKSTSIFHGYSDLSCVLNVLAPIRPCMLFQIRQNTHQNLIEQYLRKENEDLVVDSALGGNIRCFLKLAGTPYFPDLRGQRLFLESRSGDWYRISSFFAQLEMMGVFDQISSLCLGQFTELSQKGQYGKLVQRSQCWSVPVTFLDCVGHSNDSKALRLEMCYE